MKPKDQGQPTKRLDTGTDQSPKDSSKQKFEKSGYSNGNNFEGDKKSAQRSKWGDVKPAGQI